jgi:hypothetical protein
VTGAEEVTYGLTSDSVNGSHIWPHVPSSGFLNPNLMA